MKSGVEDKMVVHSVRAMDTKYTKLCDGYATMNPSR